MSKRLKQSESVKLEVSSLQDLAKIKNSSVDEISCIGRMQYMPARLRGQFFEEMYRVLKVGAKATVVVPYYSSMRSIADYATEWPPICEMSFLCASKKWREDNKIHLELKCDFDFVYGYAADSDTAARSQDVQAFWMKHYLNAAPDLHVTLTRK